ncbi:MAG: pitrilysin family protein [Planctomycetota bacterium]
MSEPVEPVTPSAAASSTPGVEPPAAAPVAAATPVVRTTPTLLQDRPDRRIVELPNRMILVAQDLPTAPVVSVQAWVKTGSLYEQEHVGAGLSHFLEHLISGGTTAQRPEAVSTATLGRIGAQTNAATSLDTVRYYINTTSDHTATAVELLSDWMQNSVILESEYERERDVIQNEFSMGQGDPVRIHWKLTQQARYHDTPDHPGAHPTIGYLDEFLKITRDEIYDFYKRMYVPNNMVFLVVGDIDPPAVIDQLTNLWGGLPAGDLPELSFPVATGEATPVTLHAPAAVSRPRVRLVWPGVKLGSEHDFALDLLAGVLGGGESSRLVRELRDNRQLVTTIQAFNWSTHWGEGFFGIDYELADPAMRDATRAAIAAHLDRLRLEPVTAEELDRVKRQTLARVVNAGQSAEALAAQLAGNLISASDPDYAARYAQAVQAVTPQDLMAAAQALLDPDAASVARLDPAGLGQDIAFPSRLPDPEASDSAASREPVELDNYSLIAQLKQNLARPGDERPPLAVDPPQRRTLDNGLTVIVQRSTVVPAVSMQLYTRGGLLADDPGREGVANTAYAMLTRGTADRSAQELAAAIEDLGASLSAASGNNTGYLRATALAADWPVVMELMAEVALEPAFDPAEWDRLRPRLLAAIDRATDTWSGELRSVFRQAYYGDHPWSQLTTGRGEVVESLTADDLRDFYRSRQSAADSILAVVGDVDPEDVFTRAQTLWGPMAAQPDSPLVLPQPAPPTPGLTVVATEKPVAAVQVGYGPGITRDSPDYPVIQVLSRVLGDFPAGWLQQELRGRGPGLVYASHAGAAVGLVPGYFTMLFNTQPDTVDDALERTLGVADRARSELVDDTTLNRAKAKVLTTEFFGRQTHSDLAAGQALDLLYGIDDPDGQAFLAKVQALTAQDVREAARKYLGAPTVVVITHEPIDEDQLRDMLR